MHLRTLLFFNCENEYREFEIAQLQPLCMKLRLLRVLDLEKLSFRRSPESEEIRLLDEIGKLIHLRYLGLRETDIYQISSYIGNLHALQTLELGGSQDVPVQLPDEICYTKQLRRLLGHFKWPFPVDNLTKLQTLKRVTVEDQMEFDPTVLINLRELWVEFVRRDRRITLDSIGGLRNLQFLVLDGSFPALQPLSQSQNLIQMALCFVGAWKLPAEVHQFPPNLKYLSIDADLTEDPFPVLEKLPNLTVLKLRSYDGAKLACSAGGFPRLEILQVSGFFDGELEVVDGELEVEEGGMSMLKGLRMTNFHLSNISGRLSSIPVAPEINFFERMF